MKLNDCIKRYETAEIFILPSGRASVLFRKLRDRETQASLSLETPMLFVRDAELAEVLDHRPVQAIIAALGVGIQIEELSIDLERLRYARVIIAIGTASVARHNAAQVLEFLRIYCRPLIEEGYVYTLTLGAVSKLKHGEFTARVLDSETRRLQQVTG